jgi:hypothetical protein
MPELSSSTYSETDDSNNAASPNGMPEGMAPSGVNNSWRAGMGSLKRFHGRIQGMYASTGSANAYVLTPSVALAAYVTGERYSFRSNFANTGSATLNISALGAKTIKKLVGAAKTTLAANDIISAQPVTVEYDGTDMIMVTPTGNEGTVTSVATAGMATGGPITSTGAVTVSITALSAETAPAQNDELALYDASAAAHDKITAANLGKAVAPRGHIDGLTLSNSAGDATNDIDIAAGKARDGTDAWFLVNASSLTKQLDVSWAVGTNQGGLDTGAVGNNIYAVWLIGRSDTGVVDALFSLSFSSPTMPTNYDLKCLIGFVWRESGANVAFLQNGDIFLRKVPVADINVTNPGTSAVARTISCPPGHQPIFTATIRNATSTDIHCLLTEIAQTNTAAGDTAKTFTASSGATYESSVVVSHLRVDASRQLRSRQSASGASDEFYIITHGVMFNRGRNA